MTSEAPLSMTVPGNTAQTTQSMAIPQSKAVYSIGATTAAGA